MNPVPKNVISVPPLDGTNVGLKYVGLKGANNIKEFSFAKIFEIFLLSVPSVNFIGPLSENF